MEHFLLNLPTLKGDFDLEEPGAIDLLTGLTKWFQDKGKRPPKPSWMDIVYTYFLNDEPAPIRNHMSDIETIMVFTNRRKAERAEFINEDIEKPGLFYDDLYSRRIDIKYDLKPMMLGKLCERLRSQKDFHRPQIIKVNPVPYACLKQDAHFYLPEDIIILPPNRFSEAAQFIGNVENSKGFHWLSGNSDAANLGLQTLFINPLLKNDYPDKMLLLDTKKRISRLSSILEKTIIPPGSLSLFIICFDCASHGEAAEKLFRMMIKKYPLRERNSKIAFVMPNFSIMNSTQEEIKIQNLMGNDRLDEMIALLKRKL